MATILPVINQVGPLPITKTVESMSDGESYLVLSGSAWTTTANSPIGIRVVMDGVAVAQATIFANPTSTHLALVTTMVPIKTTIGKHTFEIVALTPHTVTDLNDYFSLNIVY